MIKFHAYFFSSFYCSTELKCAIFILRFINQDTCYFFHHFDFFIELKGVIFINQDA